MGRRWKGTCAAEDLGEGREVSRYMCAGGEFTGLFNSLLFNILSYFLDGTFTDEDV